MCKPKNLKEIKGRWVNDCVDCRSSPGSIHAEPMVPAHQSSAKTPVYFIHLTLSLASPKISFKGLNTETWCTQLVYEKRKIGSSLIRRSLCSDPLSSVLRGRIRHSEWRITAWRMWCNFLSNACSSQMQCRYFNALPWRTELKNCT